jgi:hypothetical protein
MIARIWKGKTKEADSSTYLEYLKSTGLKDYRETAGSKGVMVLQNTDSGVTEFNLISFWESYESIRKFAGDDIDVPVYYPEDIQFLLELENKVSHYDVCFNSFIK